MEMPLYKHSFKAGDRTLTTLSVLNTGMQRCAPGYRWGPGMRDHYLIHYVMRGSGSYQVRDRTYHLSQGDMFLVWPHEMIIYQADERDPWSYCWVGFGGLDASELIKQTDLTREKPVLHVEEGDIPRALMLDIYESRGARPFEVARMTGKLYAFLAWLMESARIETKRRRQAGVEHVQRACEFIANNYQNPITIQDIAHNVGVCRSLLNRAFQEHMEVSPVQYLTKYRMAQACLLLKRTDMSIKAVAYSVGFEDPLYFSRRFREVTGISPRAYAEGEGTPEDERINELPLR